MQEKRETDESLVVRAQKGDRGASEEILRRYKDTVRSIARRRAFYPTRGGDTEDFVQEGKIGQAAPIEFVNK